MYPALEFLIDLAKEHGLPVFIIAVAFFFFRAVAFFILRKIKSVRIDFVDDDK